MKTIVGKGTVWVLLTGMMFFLGNSSCTTDNDITIFNETYITTGNASGSQQNPVVNTAGTASLTGTYNTTINSWQYSINWNSLSSAATAVQLYGPADVGLNGTFISALAISTPGINGSASGSVILTDMQEAYLLAGRLYYTILTTSHNTGEIRGQITARTH